MLLVCLDMTSWFPFWGSKVFSHLHPTFLGPWASNLSCMCQIEKMRKYCVLVPLLPNKLPQNLWTSNSEHLMSQSFCESGIVVVTHLGGSGSGSLEIAEQIWVRAAVLWRLGNLPPRWSWLAGGHSSSGHGAWLSLTVSDSGENETDATVFSVTSP